VHQFVASGPPVTGAGEKARTKIDRACGCWLTQRHAPAPGNAESNFGSSARSKKMLEGAPIA
jgi:hypothetical protein